jgi:lipopolysaccharide/colanic/teichoic acid biosynthesis glycosyltransferase
LDSQKHLDLVWHDAPARGFYQAYVKSAVDVVAAAVLFVCCLPLLLILALVIMIDSAGTPLYKQLRVGIDGKPFTLYKLRTMYHGADEYGFRTLPGDERITRLGAFLRDKKIDELPQLWNVLRGEMSLIGPRPLSVEETEHFVEQGYTRETPGLYPKVRTGLTGLEQCTRSSLHPEGHRFWLNHHYENNVSLWLDAWCLKRTLLVCPMAIAIAAFPVVVTLLYLLPYLH